MGKVHLGPAEYVFSDSPENLIKAREAALLMAQVHKLELSLQEQHKASLGHLNALAASQKQLAEERAKPPKIEIKREVVEKVVKVPVEVVKEIVKIEVQERIVEKPVEIIKEVQVKVPFEVQVVKEVEVIKEIEVLKEVQVLKYRTPKWAQVVMALGAVIIVILSLR